MKSIGNARAAMREIIRFRRLHRAPVVVDGITITYWEIARSEAELFTKLNGDMAEIDMPARPWHVRLWLRWFPLQGGPGPVR